MKFFPTVLLLIFFTGSGLLISKNIPNNKNMDHQEMKNNFPKIYIDCNYCDNDHIRTNMTFVNYVRDTKEAEVYILITRLRTGSGGRKYTIEFNGQKKFKGINDTIYCITGKNDTDDLRRTKLLKKIKLGMIQYIKNSRIGDYIDINYTKDGKPDLVIDKWNKWVFNLSLGGWFNGEESYKSRNIHYSVSADRVTESSRIRIRGGVSDRKSSYTVDDEKIDSISKSKSLRAAYIGSLGKHWSFGGGFQYYSSTYSNKKNNIRFTPQIEYNVYPYSEATKRQFRFMYNFIFERVDYYEETIYGKLRENLFSNSISAALEIKEKWGSIDSSLEFSNYLHDLSKYSIEFDSSINWRIFKGLSFEVSGGYSIIHDQLYLPKGDLTTEEILLRTSAIETSYNYWASVGLRLTLGSIYNNIVNPRFGY